jgi:hypothetical protein
MRASSACNATASGVVSGASLVVSGETVLDRADHAGRVSARTEDRLEQIAGGGLAARPGDADDAHVVARPAGELVRGARDEALRRRAARSTASAGSIARPCRSASAGTAMATAPRARLGDELGGHRSARPATRRTACPA